MSSTARNSKGKRDILPINIKSVSVKVPSNFYKYTPNERRRHKAIKIRMTNENDKSTPFGDTEKKQSKECHIYNNKKVIYAK